MRINKNSRPHVGRHLWWGRGLIRPCRVRIDRAPHSRGWGSGCRSPRAAHVDTPMENSIGQDNEDRRIIRRSNRRPVEDRSQTIRRQIEDKSKTNRRQIEDKSKTKPNTWSNRYDAMIALLSNPPNAITLTRSYRTRFMKNYLYRKLEPPYTRSNHTSTLNGMA